MLADYISSLWTVEQSFEHVKRQQSASRFSSLSQSYTGIAHFHMTNLIHKHSFFFWCPSLNYTVAVEENSVSVVKEKDVLNNEQELKIKKDWTYKW